IGATWAAAWRDGQATRLRRRIPRRRAPGARPRGRRAWDDVANGHRPLRRVGGDGGADVLAGALRRLLDGTHWRAALRAPRLPAVLERLRQQVRVSPRVRGKAVQAERGRRRDQGRSRSRWGRHAGWTTDVGRGGGNGGSVKLRRVTDPTDPARGVLGWSFYCPGCDRGHTFWTSGNLVWNFNGDA